MLFSPGTYCTAGLPLASQFALHAKLAGRGEITPQDLNGVPLIGLERGTRLGEAVRRSFAIAGAPFDPTVEVRYCNTACVLAAAGEGERVQDAPSPCLPHAAWRAGAERISAGTSAAGRGGLKK